MRAVEKLILNAISFVAINFAKVSLSQCSLFLCHQIEITNDLRNQLQELSANK